MEKLLYNIISMLDKVKLLGDRLAKLLDVNLNSLGKPKCVWRLMIDLNQDN